MEEELKKIECLIERCIKKCDECKMFNCIGCEICWIEVQAIKKLLEQYKDLKRVNSDLQGEQEQLYDKLDKLEEENAMLKKANNISEDVTVEDITQVMNKSLEDFKREFIPISVIQNKLETLELIIKQINEDNPMENVQEYQTQIEVLQELLEERNK